MTNPMTRDSAISAAKNILANPDKYFLWDTETSGVTGQSEILEMAMVSLSGDVLFHDYFMPSGDISADAIKINTLTKHKLQEKGAKPYNASHDKIKKIASERVPIAYNASFDIRVLRQSAAVYGLPMPFGDTFICAMQLATAFYREKRALNGNHTAIGDCLTMLDLLKDIADGDSDNPSLTCESHEDIKRHMELWDVYDREKKLAEAKLNYVKNNLLTFMEEKGLEIYKVPELDKMLKLNYSCTQIQPNKATYEELEEKYPGMVQTKKVFDRTMVKQYIGEDFSNDLGGDIHFEVSVNIAKNKLK